jgi:hypothetical protein
MNRESNSANVAYSLIAAAVALLLGAVFLLISYLGVDDSHPFLKNFTHEIGFALVVAVVIWLTFEFFSRSTDEQRWLARIEVISRNVFMGVFRRRLPEGLVNEITLLVLNHNFIRESIHVTYTITDHHFMARDGSRQNFVCLNATARLKIRNVSEAKCKLPIVLGLPNPLIDEMKQYCKVNKASYKEGGIETPFDLRAAEHKFREDLQNDNKFTATFDLGPVDVQPNVEVELFWDYTMAKEEEDTEIFQTVVPAQQLV